MKLKLWFAVLTPVLLSFALLQPGAALAGTYTIFDVPASLCGTSSAAGPCQIKAVSMNSQGTVAGFYSDANYLTHGFYRTASGVITSFDYPGECLLNRCSTEASAINDSGIVVGQYFNGRAYEGFWFDSSSGHFTTITVPGGTNVEPTAIDAAGTIVGAFQYTSGPVVDYAFVLQPSGVLTIFSGPQKGPYASTFPVAINSQGEIAGTFFDSKFDGDVYGAFLRSASGFSETRLNLCTSSIVYVAALDDGGQAYGNCSNGTGYIADRAGNYTFFNLPGVAAFYISAANDTGTAIGGYIAANSGISGGFYRLKDGSLGYFDPPGSYSDNPTAIDSAGEIAGWFYDTAGNIHGYVRADD